MTTNLPFSDYLFFFQKMMMRMVLKIVMIINCKALVVASKRGDAIREKTGGHWSIGV